MAIQKKRVISLVLFLLLAGCGPHNLVETKGWKSYGFDKCKPEPTETQIVGVVRVLLPSNIDISSSATHVFKTYGKFIGNDDPNNTGGATAEDKSAPPFHIHLEKDEFDHVGYVLVRFIIPVGATYDFSSGWDGSKPMNGVAESVNKDKLLCGQIDLSSTPSAKRVASFYIDLSKRKKMLLEPSFNLLLREDHYVDTPIIIDPKVHDDGVTS